MLPPRHRCRTVLALNHPTFIRALNHEPPGGMHYGCGDASACRCTSEEEETIPKRKFGNEEHRVVDVDFEIVKAGQVVIETENGVRARVQVHVNKVFVAVDNDGNVVRNAQGEPLINVEWGNSIRAEISDTAVAPPV